MNNHCSKCGESFDTCEYEAEILCTDCYDKENGIYDECNDFGTFINLN